MEAVGNIYKNEFEKVVNEIQNFNGTFGSWKVDKLGNMSHKNGYNINYFMLSKNWLSHLQEKNWIDFNEFIPAYLYALECTNIKIIKVSYETSIKNNKYKNR